MPEIEFSLRDFFHPLAIGRLRREFEEHARAPLESWRAWRDAKLREVVRVAYEQTEWYRRLFDERHLAPNRIAGESDLALLPVLTKEDVRRGATQLHARDAARHGARPSFTSGTSGDPVPFLVDRHARVLEFVYYWRHWSWAGFKLGDRFAQMNAHHFLARGWHDRVAHWQPHLRRLMLNSAALSLRNAHEYAAAMRSHRVRFLKGLASPLYFLAIALEERGVRDLAVQALFSTGENLVPARRAVMERVLRGRALDSYGLLEQAGSICECLEGGLHVNADYCVHEFVATPFTSSDGAPLHRLVGTPLHNRSMPLLRYDVGDLVELAPPNSSCRCGRTLPLVKAVHGRSEDAVVTPDGRFVTALFVVPDSVPGVRGVQFVQESERELVVRVVPTVQFDERHERDFVAHAQRLVGPQMKVALVRVGPDELKRGPTGKVPLVLSSVSRARAVAQGSENVP
jgi:phenylacetate-CoA ligase